MPKKPQLADVIHNVPFVDPLAASIPGTQIIYHHRLPKHWLTTEPLRRTAPLSRGGHGGCSQERAGSLRKLYGLSLEWPAPISRHHFPQAGGSAYWCKVGRGRWRRRALLAAWCRVGP